MDKYLRELCTSYTQDFDVIYKKDTDPIEDFCRRHNQSEQEELLQEMQRFLEMALSGKSTLRDLVNMGLEYVPGDPASFDWLQRLIEYLQRKITR